MGTWGFSYDSLNRLATGSATWPDATPQFACWQYDSFGNRLQQEVSSAAFQSGSGGASACSAQSSAYLSTNLASYYSNNQIQSTNARGVISSPGYDASGNITSDGANQYLYDAEGRICAVYTNSIVGASMTGYLYDADGARTAKGSITAWFCDPTTNGFQFTESYVLGPGGEQLTQFDGSGNWQRTNVYAAGKLLATYDMVANPLYTYGGSQPAQIAALHFHLEDPLGTRRMQLSGELANLGQPETDIQSLPFGDGLNSFPDQYAPPSTADDSTPLHFTGKERDAESGNDYFGARYYASSMGRMMSPDPSQLLFANPANPQSFNLYAYASNNPLMFIDPNGLDGDCPPVLASADGGSGDGGCSDNPIPDPPPMPPDQNCQGSDCNPDPDPVLAADALAYYAGKHDPGCLAYGLRQVLASGETPGEPDNGYGTVVRGTVISAPAPFQDLIGTTNAQIDDPSSLTGHPGILVQVNKSLRSTAFGRYQIIKGSAGGMTDFSPAGQDAYANAKLNSRGATAQAANGNFSAAMSDAGKEWASMPGSPYGQGGISLQSAAKTFTNAVLSGCK